MTLQELKQKVADGQLSDDELNAMLSRKTTGKSNFVKNIMKGYAEAVTVPNMWKITLEALLILTVIIAAVILSYTGKMDTTITAVLLASVLGFLFGKLK